MSFLYRHNIYKYSYKYSHDMSELAKLYKGGRRSSKSRRTSLNKYSKMIRVYRNQQHGGRQHGGVQISLGFNPYTAFAKYCVDASDQSFEPTDADKFNEDEAKSFSNVNFSKKGDKVTMTFKVSTKNLKVVMDMNSPPGDLNSEQGKAYRGIVSILKMAGSSNDIEPSFATQYGSLINDKNVDISDLGGDANSTVSQTVSSDTEAAEQEVTEEGTEEVTEEVQVTEQVPAQVQPPTDEETTTTTSSVVNKESDDGKQSSSESITETSIQSEITPNTEITSATDGKTLSSTSDMTVTSTDEKQLSTVSSSESSSGERVPSNNDMVSDMGTSRGGSRRYVSIRRFARSSKKTARASKKTRRSSKKTRRSSRNVRRASHKNRK